MKSKVKITSAIITIILAMAISPIYAQWGFKVGEENKMPSADTWNFIKYGEVGASLHSGTVNLSIPIYTYRDNDFTIPVSLNYSSNGYVANVSPGTLGPDWVLNAGGKISVEMRGSHDFYEKGNAFSYYTYHTETPASTSGKYWRFANISGSNLGLGALYPEIIYIPDPELDVTNTVGYYAEPDFFHFNFMGYSGTFHLGLNNNIYVYNTNGDNKLIKIDISDNYDIIITDKNGYIYEFSIFNGDAVPFSSMQDRPAEKIAYNLSKITAPNGRTARFIYDTEYTSYRSYRPASYASEGAIYDFTNVNDPLVEQHAFADKRILETISDVLLPKSIFVDNNKIIEFSYNSYTSTDEYVENIEPANNQTLCKTLESIKVLNPYASNNAIIRQANFTYLSTNNPLVHFLSSVTISGEGTYSFEYKDIPDSSLPLLGTYSVDHWGYYNGAKTGNYLKIVDGNANTLDETLVASHLRVPNTNKAAIGMLERITYPTGGYSQMEYEAHNYGKAFRRNSNNNFFPTLVNENGVCGGLRIKSVSNHLADGSQISKKTYSYTNQDGSSSGILLYFPKYWLKYSASAGPYDETNISYWSNNLISHNGSHIEYSTVTQTNSDNSKEVFHFSNSAISDKYRDSLAVRNIANEETIDGHTWNVAGPNFNIRNIVTPLLSKRAERGKLLKHEIYAAGELTPVKEITYTYDTTRTLSSATYPVYLIRKFGHIPVYTDNWRLISKTEKENNGTASTTRTETYTYNAKGQMSSATVTASNGTQEITRYTYPYDHSSEGGIYTTMLGKNLHGYPVSETRYVVKDGIEKQIWGKKYSYTLVNNMVKPSALYNFNTASGTWDVEYTYTQYDTFGNLIESRDANNIPTSHIWGYGGLYMVGIAENTARSALPASITTAPLAGEIDEFTASNINSNGNILLTTYHYEPLIGITKIRYPNGESESYTYNSSGKLLDVKDRAGKKTSSTYYSPDNRK